MVNYEVINHIQEAGFLLENKTANMSAPEKVLMMKIKIQGCQLTKLPKTNCKVIQANGGTRI